ncbi:MAG: acyltransferase [Geodermatophilaceae bacterium]|nr:acyltransferase [Geodermatophilaceae bacterium]
MNTTADDEQATELGSGPRRDIQGLRAVALVLILLSSLGVSQFSAGFVGIDVFFVLTGFFITGLLVREANERRNIDVLEFLARRARRLLPMATLVLLVTLVASFVLFDDDDRIGSTATEALWASGLVANWKYFLNGDGYFEIFPTSPVQHFWAVSVGGQFTLLWPLLLLLILFIGARRAPFQRKYIHRPSARRAGLLVAVISLVGVASLLLAVMSAESGGVAYFSILTRLWEFVAGALLVLGVDRLGSLPGPAKAAMSWLGLAGIVAAAVVFDQDAPFPGTPALLPVLATILVLVGGVDGPRYGAGGLLSLAPLTWLGDRSYGIYLWHLPALVFAAEYVDQDLNLLEGTVITLGVVALSAVTYALIERPLRTGAPFNRGKVGLVLGPVSVAVVTVVVLVSQDAITAAPTIAGDPPPISTSTAPTSTAPPTTPPTPAQVIADGVLQTVLAADSGDSVSTRITDRLGGLAADTWTDDTPCISAFGSTTSDVCFYGPENAEQTMVIFGDAHAAMWVPTLRQIAADSGWKFYYFVKESCTSSGARLLDAVRQNREAECDSWRDWAIDQIIGLAPDLTILANNGTVAITGEGDDRLTADEQTAAWEAGMLETLQTFGELPRVVAFSQAPVGPDDPVVCLDQENVLLSACTFLFGRAADATNNATQRAVATSGSEYLDVTPFLCAGNKCPPINLADIMYSAQGQLTRSYAVKLAPAIAYGLGIS